MNVFAKNNIRCVLNEEATPAGEKLFPQKEYKTACDNEMKNYEPLFKELMIWAVRTAFPKPHNRFDWYLIFSQ